MRMKRSDIDALQREGAIVQRKKKIEKPAPPAPAPKPAAARPPAPATDSKAVVAAIHALAERIERVAKEQPERKPAPYRFTISRNPKTGLIESCLAEPLKT